MGGVAVHVHFFDVQAFVIETLRGIDPEAAEWWNDTSISDETANAILRECEKKYGKNCQRYPPHSRMAVSDVVKDVYQQEL